MRLFYALLRRKNMPNGNIHTGKHKIIKPVTNLDYWNLKRDLEIEEKNMFYLRNPYLSLEQSRNHTAVLEKKQKNFQELLKSRKRNFYDNVTLESRLGHLRYKESWE